MSRLLSFTAVILVALSACYDYYPAASAESDGGDGPPGVSFVGVGTSMPTAQPAPSPSPPAGVVLGLSEGEGCEGALEEADGGAVRCP